MLNANKYIQNVPFSIDTLIKGMPEIAYAFSNEAKLLAWNKNLEILLGYTKDELNGKFGSEFIYEEDKDRVVKKFIGILAKGDDKKRTSEHRIVTKHGKIIPILAMRSFISVDGKDYVIGIAIDISKLKNDEVKLKTHVSEIILLKNQLSDYFHKIEKMNQAVIELKEKLFLNAKNFSNKLINNLPGIFYLYEKVDNRFLLKKWNKKFTTDLGYRDDEILNRQLHQFFSKKEYKKIEKAIIQTFSTGSTQVEIYTTHKNGKQIPYYYQGYQFKDNGKIFFMGVGIDISAQYALEKKQDQQKIKKQKEKVKSDANKRELIASALQISETSEIIKHTLKLIDKLTEKQEETEPKTKIRNDLKTIKNKLQLHITQQNNWEIFKHQFTKVHKDFFTHLKAENPLLSKSELKFCTYLKINLSSSQISSIQNVTKEAIKKTRYRIRKKLDLSPKDSLEDYIAKF